MSISFLLSSNSNSPYFESNVPFCNDRRRRVNRGPSSHNATFLKSFFHLGLTFELEKKEALIFNVKSRNCQGSYVANYGSTYLTISSNFILYKYKKDFYSHIIRKQDDF